VSHAGRQAADGGQFLGMLHLMDGAHALLVVLLQAFYELAGQTVNGQEDGDDAGDEDEEQIRPHRVPGAERRGLGLDGRESEIGVRDEGRGEKISRSWESRRAWTLDSKLVGGRAKGSGSSTLP
jgi:hypothetical protein